MSKFSSTVKVGDLNDFIAPSQACVVSLQGKKLDPAPPAELQEGQVQLQSQTGGFRQTYTEQEGGPIKVTLHDCLACSGCVTSAETVLLQHQSTEEFVQRLRDPSYKVVVSVSPQSRASLAVLHGLPSPEVQSRLTGFLKQLQADLVLDIGPARDMALCEAAAEFLERYQRSKEASTSQPAAPAARRQAVAAEASRTVAAGRQQLQHMGSSQLPMLASACPGWICYGEKTHGDFILPYLSTTKSPQAVMGTLVKRHLAAALGWDPARIYHATVMPCYDKKLEASREDFYLLGTTIPEVDCCLTTGEVQQLLDEHAVQGQLSAVAAAPLDTLAQLLPGMGSAAAAVLGESAAAAMEVDQPECNGPGSSRDSSSSKSGGVLLGVEYCGGGSGSRSQGEYQQQQERKESHEQRLVQENGQRQHDHQQQEEQQRGQQQLVRDNECPQHDHQQQEGQDEQGMLVQQPQQAQGLFQQQQQQGQREEGWLQQEEEELLLHSRPGSSGGYMDFVFRVAAWQLFGVQLPGKGLVATKQLRNADFQELLLQDEEGKTLLRFASAYGFRNIQSLMRKIKGGKCEYDYVEVMACPGGCLNGAGQIAPGKGKTAVQLLEELEMKYYVPMGDDQQQQEGQQQGREQQQQQGLQKGERERQEGAVREVIGQEEEQQYGQLPQHRSTAQHPAECNGHGQGNGHVRLREGEQQQQQQPLQVQPGVIKLLQPLTSGGTQRKSSSQEGDMVGEVGGGRGGAAARVLYGSWVGGAPGSEAAKTLLHTQYHHRKKTVANMISDW